jgi:hypothetical protein
VERFEAPGYLTADEREVWDRQAEAAFAARTLTRATQMAFERYCSVAALERNERRSSAAGGANHRGLLKQINAYELQFLLAPCGKPLPEAAPAAEVDFDDAFFGGVGAGHRRA